MSAVGHVPFRDNIGINETEVKLKCPACNRRSDFRYVPALGRFNGEHKIEPCIFCYEKLMVATSQEDFDEILASLGASRARKRRNGDAGSEPRSGEGWDESWDK